MRRAPQDVLNERYQAVVPLRLAGLSYRAIAARLGLSSAQEALNAFNQARVAAIPVDRSRPHPKPSETFVAWAAGFFDGEGCIFGYESVQGGRWRSFSFGLQVCQVSREPLDELQAAYGGGVRFQAQSNPRHRDQFAWSIKGLEAAWFLEDVLPHLRVKYEEARVALPCLFRTHRKGVGFTEAEVELRRSAIAALRSAKTKGRRA